MTVSSLSVRLTTEWPADDLEIVTTCPVCDTRSRKLLYNDLRDRVFFCAPGAWTLYRCVHCEAAFLDPRPNRDSIGRAYKAYYTHELPTVLTPVQPQPIPFGELRLALRNGYFNARFGYQLRPSIGFGAVLAYLQPYQRAREDRLVRHLRFPGPGARLLDVGCGNGLFLKRISTLGWQATGVEPDPAAAAAARREGLDVREGFLEEHTFPAETFDVVTLGHVIEHVHDPLMLIKTCRRVLKPGGVLWIATPNLAALGHRKFRKNWLGLDAPRHLVLFTPRALRMLLERAGYERIQGPIATWEAGSMFQASAAIARGVEPLKRPPQLTPAQRWQARLADLMAWLMPAWSEELVLMAQKPGRQG